VRIFVWPEDLDITPLGAPARAARVLDSTVGEAMARRFARAGLTAVAVASREEGEDRAGREPGGAFVVADAVLGSRRVVEGFVRAAPRSTGATALVCALPRVLGTDRLSHVGGLEACDAPGGPAWTAPFFFLRGPGSLARAAPLVLRYREHTLRYPMPAAILGGPEELLVGASDSILCRVGHWVHVIRINTAAIADWWFERLRQGVVGPAWMLGRALAGFPWTGGRLLGAMRRVEAGARVHHTANVELSIVGRGARVGAHATIRNAFIGEDAQVGVGACVVGSVVGRAAFVGVHAVVSGSVLYPGAMAAQLLMQASLLGENAGAFTNSYFFDINFTRNVQVASRGGLVDSGSRVLGVCLGPGARVSAGVWVASGREVPAGALLIKPPGEIVTSVPSAAGGAPQALAAGALRPLLPRSSG
jgi:acetyltransferase-like isoleucine patch superfamily enzyme